MNLDSLGGRKLLATLAILLIGGATVVIKGDLPDNFLYLLMSALGMFVGGNVAEHWSKNIAAVKGGGAPGASPQVAAVESKVDAQTELLLATAKTVQATNQMLLEARGAAQRVSK